MTVTETIQELARHIQQEIDSLRADNDRLEESLVDRALALEDVGWKVISGYAHNDDGTGLKLENLHTLSEKLREMAASNPWHVRGSQLRHSYVFGRGMSYADTKPRTEKVIETPHNMAVLSSVEAYEVMNLALFTDGAFVLVREQTTNQFTAVPIAQVKGVITNPDDAMDIRYIKRVWTANGEERQEWIPLSRYKNTTAIRKSITETRGERSVPVAQNKVVYIKHTKRQSGWTWGVPDSLAAYIWTLAYSGYLQDNVKLVAALSKFAWSLTRNNKSSAEKAAAQIAAPGVGGTASMGEGNSLASVGVPSAQVNMNNGQPLIAAVATSFGVPTIALLSSPGSTGGSYGAATTLDQPTLKGFEALQDSWKLFFEEILHDLGSPKARVEFPSIDSDPVHRQITSLVALVELGIIWPDEARDAALDLLDVEKMHNDMPPKPDVSGTLVSRQGVSADGVVGDTSNNGETDHSLETE